jgi:hypothetical protein
MIWTSLTYISQLQSCHAWTEENSGATSLYTRHDTSRHQDMYVPTASGDFARTANWRRFTNCVVEAARSRKSSEKKEVLLLAENIALLVQQNVELEKIPAIQSCAKHLPQQSSNWSPRKKNNRVRADNFLFFFSFGNLQDHLHSFF